MGKQSHFSVSFAEVERTPFRVGYRGRGQESLSLLLILVDLGIIFSSAVPTMVGPPYIMNLSAYSYIISVPGPANDAKKCVH